MGLFSTLGLARKKTEEPKKAQDTLKDPLSTGAQDPIVAPKPSAAKLLTNHLHKTFNTSTFRKQEKWKTTEAKRVANSLSVEEAIERFRDPFYAFAHTELGTENIDCWEAIKGGADKRSIWATYLAVGSPAEVNIGNAVRKPLAELDAQERWGEMDFGEVLKDLRLNMTDTLVRARQDESFLAAVASTCVPPDGPGVVKQAGEKVGAWLGKTFNTKGHQAKERSRSEQQIKAAEAHLETVFVDEAMKKYRDPLFAFALTEYSEHELEAYEAIKGGVSPRSLFKTYIEVGAPAEVNLGNDTRGGLIELAHQERWDEMDFGRALKTIKANIADTYSRAKFNKAFLTKVASSLPPPPDVG